jgi:hypothetical protein
MKPTNSFVYASVETKKNGAGDVKKMVDPLVDPEFPPVVSWQRCCLIPSEMYQLTLVRRKENVLFPPRKNVFS